MIYRSGEMKSALLNRHLYIRWHLVPLPRSHHNKVLHFRFFSDHPWLIGIVSPVYLGNETSILRKRVLRDLDFTMLGIILLLGGAFSGFFLMAYYRYRMRSPILLSLAPSFFWWPAHGRSWSTL